LEAVQKQNEEALELIERGECEGYTVVVLPNGMRQILASQEDMDRPKEDPCSDTGKPCRWYADDYTEYGGPYHVFCLDCGRERDFGKDELKEEDE
jgi:hypothetical protein